MENITEYLDLVAKTEKLRLRALEIIQFIEKLHPQKFAFYEHIDKVSFYNDEVSIESSETYRGSTDMNWTSFPSQWLFLPNEEITALVIAQKDEYDKMVAEREAKAKADKLVQDENKQRELYLSLKKKFESN